MSKENSSLDLVGLGKVVHEIPDTVFEQTTDTVLTTFTKLVSPLTETTSGLGRYIKQKFDNMVDEEKAILTYSIQNAQHKAKAKNLKLRQLSSPKNFIKIMDEVSKETDPILHDLWTNLLCTELTNENSHPFFVDVLSRLSAKDAQILQSLNTFENIGSIKSNVMMHPYNITSWVKENNGAINKWDFSSNLLCELGLTKTVTPETHTNGASVVILYRTDIGESFLNAVRD